MKKLRDVLLGRCPRCGEGQIFEPGVRGLFFLNDECSVCGLSFMPEPGYYLGAMYVSYGLGVLTVLPVAIYLGVIAHWPLWSVLAIMVVQTLVSMLFFLRLSRTVWLHADQVIDPHRRESMNQGHSGPH